MFKKTIGILGGTGPIATAHAFSELLKLSQALYGAVQDTDYPTVIVYNDPLPWMSEKGFDPSDEVTVKIEEKLDESLQKLQNFGVEVLMAPCNTLHFFDEKLHSMPFICIDMIDEAVNNLIASQADSVLILSSRTTRDEAIYQSKLSASNVKCVVPNNEQQLIIDAAILSVMSNDLSEAVVASVVSLIDSYYETGVQSVLIACTELSCFWHQIKSSAKIYDAQDITLRKVLEAARG